MNGHSVEFLDFFDWEKENDNQYYKLLAAHQEWEEASVEEIVEPIIIRHEVEHPKSREVRKPYKERLQSRSYLFAKTTRAKGRFKRPPKR
jgi:hypothetical protein